MMNFINFAHGEFVMLGMYVALLIVMWLGGGPAVFGFAAAFGLFVLGVIVYTGLIRHVMRGPMLAQILSTFGLALLLRYTAFWIFSANVVSLPQTSLGGTLNTGGILVPVAQLVAGVVAAAAGRDGEGQRLQPRGPAFEVGGEDDVVGARLVELLDGDDVLEPAWVQPVVLVLNERHPPSSCGESGDEVAVAFGLSFVGR